MIMEMTEKTRTKLVKEAINDGSSAAAGDLCPYGTTDFGLRNAWLAGHYDTHGYEAWEKARGSRVCNAQNAQH
jgi:ribosome modulation factor